jgi:acetyl esterase
MPLDPELQERLLSLPAVTGPIDWAEMRAARPAAVAALEGPDGPPGVGSVEEREIPGPAGTIRLRVYRPLQAARDTLLFFYGGGWVLGDLEQIDSTARRLCRDLPAVVVSATYRLAPEHPFPAAFDDALAAARWVCANAPGLGGDPDRVNLGGTSAGANLAAAVCLALRDEARSGRPEARIAAQLLFNPALDLRSSADDLPSRRADKDPSLPVSAIHQFIKAYLQGQDAGDPRASPLAAHDLTDLPAALIAVLTVDAFRDEAVLYASRLRQGGVRAEIVEFDNLTHGFVAWAGVLPAAAVAVREVLVRFRTLLQGVAR